MATYSLGDGVRTVGGTATLGDGGSLSVTVDASTLADGSITVSAAFTDVNGNKASAT